MKTSQSAACKKPAVKVAMKATTKTKTLTRTKASMKATSKKVPARKGQVSQKTKNMKKTKAMKAMKATKAMKTMKAMKATKSTKSTKPTPKTTALGSRAKVNKKPTKKPSAKKTPSKTKVPQRWAQVYARTGADIADIVFALDLRSFKKAVKQLSDVNILQERFRDWILSLPSDGREGFRKLEILLTAGLNANMPGLLRRCVGRGASACVKLLLDHGADPIVEPAQPNAFFLFEVCARPYLEDQELEQAQAVLLELKKFLFTSPRYSARASELWRDAIEHMHEAYVQHFDRRGLIQYKKWLRDNLLQFVDEGYRVSP